MKNVKKALTANIDQHIATGRFKYGAVYKRFGEAAQGNRPLAKNHPHGFSPPKTKGTLNNNLFKW
jgi:hypothetical protein